jgi:Zn-dependent protease
VGSHCPACVAGIDPGADLTVAANRRALSPRRARGARSRPGWVFYSMVGVFLGLMAATFAVDGNPDSLAVRALAMSIVVVGALLSVTLHEWSHAYVAFRGGDRSVVDQGYLTLDFRKYAHPLLSFGLPILFLLAGGLPLPGGAVWIDRAALRSRGWASGVSIAGPLMNLLNGVVLLVVVSSGVLDGNVVLASALAFLGYVLLVIVVLNLLPVPGLDGYGAIEPWLPPGLRSALEPVRSWGFLILLLLVFQTDALGFMFDWALALAQGLGVDPTFIAWGSYLASPQLNR